MDEGHEARRRQLSFASVGDCDLGRAFHVDTTVICLEGVGRTALDGATQSKVTSNLLEAFKGRGLIWILHRPSQASLFDHVLVMRGGKVVGTGPFDDLNKPDSHLTELLAAE